MGKGLKWLIAGSVIFSVAAVGVIMAVALTGRQKGSGDSSYSYSNSNSYSYDYSSSNPLKAPSIRLVFYALDNSDSEILYETTINDDSFTWNKDIYQGEDPSLIEEGFENTFLGWFSNDSNQLLKDDMVLDLNDYEFNYQYGQRIDGKPSIFSIYKLGDKYECYFRPKFFKKSINRSVTYQSPDGDIYSVVSVPSRIYDNPDAEIDDSYFGQDPKYYDPEYPVKFVDWGYETEPETNNKIATATFTRDFDMTRQTVYFSHGDFEADSNKRFITMIHNDTSTTAFISLYRAGRELRNVTIETKGTMFFDITDGVDSFSGIVNEESTNKRIIYDYYDNDQYVVPSYNDYGSVFYSTLYTEFDLTGYHYDKPIILTDYTRHQISEESYEIVKTDRLEIELCENIELIVLDGVKQLTIRGDYEAYQSGAFDTPLPKICFPESLKSFSVSDVDTSLSYIDGKGIDYIGNKFNPYLIAMSGESNRIATGCAVLFGNIELDGYRNYDVDEYPEIVIPASVKYIYNSLECNFQTIRFEDLRNLRELKGTIKEAHFKGDVEFGRGLSFESNATFLEHCIAGAIRFPNNFVFTSNPFIRCDYEKFEFNEDVAGGKLTIEDEVLYYDGNLVTLPSRCLEETFYVKEGVKKIYADAFDEGYSFGNWYSDNNGVLKSVILPATIEEVESQTRCNARFFARGAAPVSPQIIYGCEADGSLIKHEGLIYGLYNNEAYILDYEQSEVPADLIIPDTIKARGGNTYPVTRIKRDALYSINLNSIVFGKNLEVIEDSALSYMRINSDINLPSSIKRVEESAFYGMKLSKEIQITFDTDIVDGIDHHAFYWYYHDIEWAKIIPSFVIKASSYDKFYSFFSFNKYHQFPFLPVKQLITTNGEIDNLGHYYGGFDNDVSNLFVEINNQKICFNEITEIKSESIRIDMLDLSYYFPRLEKLTIPQNLVESYVYDDGIIVDTHYYSLNELMDILLFEKEDLIETSTTMYQFDNLQIDFYFDMSEEEFIDFVKETTFHVFTEEEGNVNLKFDYDGECFYFNSKYIGIYGIPDWMTEADYEIPLKNNTTYMFKIRYLATA